MKLTFPTPQYLLSLIIALAIISFAMKMLPIRYTQYFKW